MLPWGAWWATVWATVWRAEWKHVLMPCSEEKGKDASIRWDADKSESLMCSEIDGSRDKECGVTWLQLTTPSMFNFYLIPEKGRSSKEWAPSSSPFRKKLLPTPQVPKPGNRPIGDSPEWRWLISSSAHLTLSHRVVFQTRWRGAKWTFPARSSRLVSSVVIFVPSSLLLHYLFVALGHKSTVNKLRYFICFKQKHFCHRYQEMNWS